MQIEMSSALKKLGNCDQVYVKQRMSKTELLTCDCWEARNKYDVYNGRSKIFYAEEKTGCCCRQVQRTLPDCAPFDVDIDYTGGWTTEHDVFNLKKDFSCVCCCINRPVVYMYDKEKNLVGSIRDPCPFCPSNMTFTVRDHEDNGILYAESGLCQWGLCCPCPCGPCKKVDFPIKDNDGNQVGNLQKRMKGLLKMCFCSWCFDDVENYMVDFKDVNDPRSKALLMALAIFTDFRYFNNTGDDDAGGD